MKKTLTLTKETLTRLETNEAQLAAGASSGCPTLTVACNTSSCPSRRVCPVSKTACTTTSSPL